MALTYDELSDLLQEDEKYAAELQLQEALRASSEFTTTFREQLIHDQLKEDENISRKRTSSWDDVEVQLIQTKNKRKTSERGESSQISSERRFCLICMESKPSPDMFRNKTCTHLFCSDCITQHVAVKIQENISIVKCPDPKCEGTIESDMCRSILSPEVLSRWEVALCEAMFSASEKFYCPFKDCSALMIDDGSDGVVTTSECPNCRRLFCAKCKVSWHAGSTCIEFQNMEKKKISDKEDEMVMKLAMKKNWKKCPECKIFVQKGDGCNHISCRCGCQFCYRCGSLWTATHACS